MPRLRECKETNVGSLNMHAARHSPSSRASPVMLLTSVAVVAREHHALGACPELCEVIEQFVDGPERWLRLSQTSTLSWHFWSRMPEASRNRVAMLGQGGRARSLGEFIDANEVLQVAAEKGLLHVLQWLYSRLSTKERNISTNVWKKAAENGHLHVLNWLHSLPGDGCTQDIMAIAVDIGRPDMVAWMLERYPTNWCNSFLVCCILHQGTVLRQVESTMQFYSLAPTVRAGRAEVIKFIHEHHPDFDWESLVMDSAAAGGYLDIVEFLDKNRSEGCTINAMDDAAAYGHLDIVKYLHDNRAEGCTTKAMDVAASAGHLEVVQFLHEHRQEGCSIAALDNAVRSRQYEVAKWLVENRSERGSFRTFNALARRREVDTLRCILDNWGATSDGVRLATEAALRYRSIIMLGWLYRRYPNEFDTEIVESWTRQNPDDALDEWFNGLRRAQAPDA